MTCRAVYTKNQNIYDDPTRFFKADADHRIYMVIDLKSFYASVECVERGLDPMKAKLVVADPSRSRGTICLAVSPALKALGVRNRCRVYEIPKNLDYITAPPQMQHYIDCSAEIYGVYLQYLAKEDIHVYSIDEAFLDVTDYLKLYHMTAKELGIEIMNAILDRTGIRSTCGIGTNMYLAKIALDITAKHSPDFIGILTEDTYRETLWDHQPITDFWMIAGGISRRLSRYGIHTMHDIAQTAMLNENLLYKQFGINAEILIDHAFGVETVRMSDIKNYRTESHSLSSGQVLLRDYSFDEARLIVKEMLDQLCLDMAAKGVVTQSVTLAVLYSHNWTDADGLPAGYSAGTVRAVHATSSDRIWRNLVVALYDRIIRRDAPIRRINLCCNELKKAANVCSQFSLFDDQGNFCTDITKGMEEQDRNLRIRKAVLELRARYGKNAVLKGMNLAAAGTQIERNCQVGGHKSGRMDRVALEHERLQKEKRNETADQGRLKADKL